MLGQSLVLFVVALLLALVEIEIEGKHGWAEKIPTWYRTTGFGGKLWGFIMGGKPLTGYHLFMNALILMMFHLDFFAESEWSVKKELMVLAKYGVMATFWDFLWFVLNPYYGIRKYKRKNVWWFAKSHWIFGLFPIDYAMGLGFSLILAYLGERLEDGLVLIGLFFSFTLIIIIVSPLYRRWHIVMRKKDDRDKAGIFHPLP